MLVLWIPGQDGGEKETGPDDEGVAAEGCSVE